MTPPRILIVAGSDSGGGAGIQADIKTVTMLGGFAMTAVTAITAQNSLGVQAVHRIPTQLVLAQIDSVCEDLGVDAVKIGMIGSAETAAALADRLARLDGVPIVFDPVMVASSGAELADAATVAAFERLAGIATVTTPNLPELETLSSRQIASAKSMEAVALDYAGTIGAAILAKGGHLTEAPLTDLLADPRGSVRRWTSERIDTRDSHGTGCTLSSAIATGLGRGLSLVDAVSLARDYVRACMLAAPGFGHGHGPMGHALGRVPVEDIHRKE
ncbi:bifunctional hydroxymethylpyrimidine kinase/phosphomethylpyrimidine kinase [Sphingosinicella terrae]|uniref:bifunctional hydroxymethylpyrimidine kinase/phosphomethylpyrimidine kinase n=1 Tax=Sphingosinicella terrae TaxID=2172047 RepID=UPI000E0DEC94|nr:bifunctional hydroxymethylpyrimidine kinase/phosphomethylpyrimidine kinase [Sphingosinicella terrae]